VSETALTGGRFLAPVCASWFSLALSSLSFVEHCVVTAGQSKTQKINNKFDVKMIRSGEQVFHGHLLRRVEEPFMCEGTHSAFGGHVLRELAACCHEMQLRFFLFVAHCHCGEKQV